MANEKHSAIYNARIPQMPTSRSRFARVACSLSLMLLLAANATGAENWASAEEQLAAKIASVTGPGTAFVDFANRSSLPRAQSDDIRRGLLTALANRGVRFASADQAAANVYVTFSEDLQQYVWVAEVHQSSNESAVVMVSLPRSETQLAVHEATALVIHKTLLWSQPDRILDVAVIDGNPAHMAVLDGNGVNIYKLQDTRWQPEQSLPVTHSRPWPRDLRGRLVLRKDHLFDAYLPGLSCRSTAKAPLALTCYESDDPWPLGTDQFVLTAFFTPARNYFTGALAPGIGKQTTAPAFYSAAPVPRGKYVLWLFATVNGQVHLLDGITDQSAGRLGWGSDIAALRSSCGSGWQVLVTRGGGGS
ncbi:MAG TPA: hypothetical protein VGV15_07675, partial [Terriglobales bacterium]|nr:hypothetical protein [Terriglobales bacterium]